MTYSDLLNMNLMLIFRFKELLPEISKRDVTRYIKMTKYVDIALSDLVVSYVYIYIHFCVFEYVCLCVCMCVYVFSYL